MAFLSRSNLKWLALSPYHLFLLVLLPVLIGGMGIISAYASSSDVQTYASDDQTTDDRFNSPLQAGQMTLEDVLAAHPAPKKLVPAPVTQVQTAPLSPPHTTGATSLSSKSPNSSTNVMLMQGMKSALDQSSTQPSALIPPQFPNQANALPNVAPQVVKPTAADIIEAVPSPSLSISPVVTIDQLPQEPVQNTTELLKSPVTTLSVSPIQAKTVAPREATQEPEVITPKSGANSAQILSPAESPTVYQPGQSPQNLAHSINSLNPSIQPSPSLVNANPANNTVPLDALSSDQLLNRSGSDLSPTAYSEASSHPQYVAHPTAAEIIAQQPIIAERRSITPQNINEPVASPTFSSSQAPENNSALETKSNLPQPTTSAEETLSVAPMPDQTTDQSAYVSSTATQIVRTPAAPVLTAPPSSEIAPTAAEIISQQQVEPKTTSNINITQPAIQPQETIKSKSKAKNENLVIETASCSPHVSSWIKTCTEAGYPESYVGQIRGETRTVCPANSLQDVWIANSCSPPASRPITTPLTVPNTEEQVASPPPSTMPSVAHAESNSINHDETIISTTNDLPVPSLAVNPPENTVKKPAPTFTRLADGTSGQCGSANAVATTIEPDKGLCSFGNPSRISGKGPWTWSCAGIKGGASASCSANKIQESQCGPATFVKTRDEPSDNLCNVGDATTVTGDGPWHWTCKNADNTSTISCEAAVITDAKCGDADGEESHKRPADNLCKTGTPSLVTASDGSWTWTCKGINGGDNDSCSSTQIVDSSNESSPTMVAPAPVVSQLQPKESTTKPSPNFISAAKVQSVRLCGAASELMAIQPPDKNLCLNGTSSSVVGNGPWSWTCSDNNGHKSNCSTLSPMGSLSDSSAEDTTGSNSQYDTISEAPTPMAQPSVPVTTTVSKPSLQISKTNETGIPQCGASAGSTLSSAPVEDFCNTGTPSALRGHGPWEWDCSTKNSSSVTCSAYKTIDAMCGKSDAAPQKQAPSKNLCEIGHPTKVKGTGPWTWSCSNENGDVSVKCAAPKIQVHVEQSAPIEVQTAETSPDAAPNSVQQETQALIKGPKPFAPAPQPTSAPNSPSPSNLKPPAEATSLPADAQPVQAPAGQPSLSVPAQDNSANEPTATSAPGFALDPEISSIPFSHSSENINSDAQILVDKLAAVLQSNTPVRITLTAYADSSGLTAREARRLSLTRALAIRDYLSSKGIANSRIDVRALGAAPSGSQDRVDIKAD